MSFLYRYRWLLGLMALAALGLVVAFSLPKRKAGGTCDCQPISTTEAVEQADLIFKGTCTYVTTNWIAGGMKYSFEVEEAWKKRCDQYMVVNSGWEQDCGYRFEQGKTYLVFANKKFSLQTNRCNGTAEFQEDLPAYERLAETPGSEISQSPMVKRMIWTIAILGILSVVFVAIVVLRKRFTSNPS